ncbi:unnamed protein product [Urochloa humidicola]
MSCFPSPKRQRLHRRSGGSSSGGRRGLDSLPTEVDSPPGGARGHRSERCPCSSTLWLRPKCHPCSVTSRPNLERRPFHLCAGRAAPNRGSPTEHVDAGSTELLMPTTTALHPVAARERASHRPPPLCPLPYAAPLAVVALATLRHAACSHRPHLPMPNWSLLPARGLEHLAMRRWSLEREG